MDQRPNNYRTIQLRTRLNEAEKAALLKLAKAEGLSPSEMVRKALAEAAAKRGVKIYSPANQAETN